MTNRVAAYEFIDGSFVNGSDPIVCIVAAAELRRFMSVSDLNHAFSGFASYRRLPWLKRYVGVWGRKNAQRLRRFLRERGAEVILHRERPERLRLMMWRTRGRRRKVRSLGA